MSRLSPTGLSALQPFIVENPFVRDAPPTVPITDEPFIPFELDYDTAGVRENQPGVFEANPAYQADARSIIDSVMMNSEQKSRALSALLAQSGGPALSPDIGQEYAAQRAAQQYQAGQSRRLRDIQKRMDDAIIDSKTREMKRAEDALLRSGRATPDTLQSIRDQYATQITAGLTRPNPVLLADAEQDQEDPARKIPKVAGMLAKRWSPQLNRIGMTPEEIAGFLWLDPENGSVQGIDEFKKAAGIREPTEQDLRMREKQLHDSIRATSEAYEKEGKAPDRMLLEGMFRKASDSVWGTNTYQAPQPGFDDDRFFPDPIMVYPDFESAAEAIIGGARARYNPPPSTPVVTSAASLAAARTGHPQMLDNDDKERILAEARAQNKPTVTVVLPDGSLKTFKVPQ